MVSLPFVQHPRTSTTDPQDSTTNAPTIHVGHEDHASDLARDVVYAFREPLQLAGFGSWAVGGPDGSESTSSRTYTVRTGDSLWRIAQKFGVDVDALVKVNRLKNANQIQPGDKLVIPGAEGSSGPTGSTAVQPSIKHKVQRGETLTSIAKKYGINASAIVSANNLANPDRLKEDQELLIPGALPKRRQEPMVSRGRLQPVFAWPARGAVTSGFGTRWGRQHEGVDIAINTGTPVRASAPGVVSFAGWNGGYGMLVIVDHGMDVETRYAHNSRLAVAKGDRVEIGDIVAYSGNTGHSTGPHLHFEVRFRGQPLNPMNYLRGR